MNEDYLNGFRDAVIDSNQFGLEFSKQLAEDLKGINKNTNYSQGYMKGYEMEEVRINLLKSL